MRRLLIVPAALVVIAWLAGTRAVLPSSAQSAAEVVLQNGKVLTVDANDSVAQAVAIAGGKIIAVGSNDAVQSPRSAAATQVIDLHGRTATPGLIDTHVHFSEADALYAVDLSDVDIKKMDDVLARVRGAGRQDRSPANGCAAAAGTKASWPSAATSRPRISTRSRPTIPSG